MGCSGGGYIYKGSSDKLSGEVTLTCIKNDEWMFAFMIVYLKLNMFTCVRKRKRGKGKERKMMMMKRRRKRRESG